MKRIILLSLGISLACIHTAHAEYYLEYPEPRLDNLIDLSRGVDNLKPKHKVKQRHVRKGYPEIEVYYVYNCGPQTPCPPVDCDECIDNDNRYPFTNQFVDFAKEYHYTYGQDPMGVGVSEDMRTRDDDVMRFPNMNNQY